MLYRRLLTEHRKFNLRALRRQVKEYHLEGEIPGWTRMSSVELFWALRPYIAFADFAKVTGWIADEQAQPGYYN